MTAAGDMQDRCRSYGDFVADKARLLVEARRYDEGLALLEAVLCDMPDHVTCRLEHARILSLCGEHGQAVQELEQLYRQSGCALDVGFTLAVTYSETGRHREALEVLAALIEKQPEMPFLHRWRGIFLERLGCSSGAECAYRAALQLKHDYAEARVSLANLWIDLGRYREAEASLTDALRQGPANVAALLNLGRLYRIQGKIDQALQCYQQVLTLQPDNLGAASNYLFALCNHADLSAVQLADSHRALAAFFQPADVLPPAPIAGQENRVLRVGYLSGDFCNHSVAYFIKGILQHHDRSRFEVYCYATANKEDAMTRHLQGLPVVWRRINGMPTLQAARIIRADKIDLLVDLSGHTAGNRLDLCASRPAPVQATWIGYPHSTGLPYIDYFITDSICDPPGMTDGLYSERLVRLPRIFCCYSPGTQTSEVSPPPHLTRGCITFGCFNSFAKLNRKLYAIWAAVLHKVADSRLHLKSAPFANDCVRQEVYTALEDLGISRERIVLMPHAETHEQHLTQYAAVDIALDTYPYNGTTTTCEALWMGVPVVTLAGDHHRARVGACLLTAVGLQDLVGYSAGEYVDLAVCLAHDTNRLKVVRNNLRTMMVGSALMDTGGVTKELEQAYAAMFAAIAGMSGQAVGSERKTF